MQYDDEKSALVKSILTHIVNPERNMAFTIALLCLLLTGLLAIIIFTAYTNKLARHSAQARHAIIKNLGISTALNPQFIGFFHPYW
jgi:alpha-1,2-mannosyltransferase